jgi:putative endonuclease
MAQHNLFGLIAEEKALKYLLGKGYCLLEKNYRYGHAEVDLLMQKNQYLICVEVKARSTDFFGSPESFITSKKIKLLVNVVDHYLENSELDLEVRFDIIAIIKKGENWIIKHIKNAFYAWQ